ncbi:MAG: thiosulfate oxidation carrier protein SoxY [Azospirillum sp.]|nr:thiosulfate oxidation carrier protein SoxY [Azospirillum sp.]
MARGMTRRTVLTGMGVVTVLGFAGAGPGLAATAAYEEELAKVLQGRTAKDGRITIDVPQIAENGNTVPLTVTVDSPMTESDFVKTVTVFADGNPRPEVAVFHFSPLSGRASAAIRMRMATTQNIVAIAEMSDGSLYQQSAQVKVTIGGCGG